jgi:hypothetical protein
MKVFAELSIIVAQDGKCLAQLFSQGKLAKDNPSPLLSARKL